MMKYSDKNYIDPTFLIDSLSNFDGTKIDIKQQKDVDEFLIHFIDLLENQLKEIG